MPLVSADHAMWYYVSIAAGLGIILLFARERMNRPLVREAAALRHRERLVALLKPAHMARRDRLAYGYGFYTVMLMIAFAAACVFLPPFGPFLLSDWLKNFEGVEFLFSEQNSPGWPILSAVILVGIGPVIPGLGRVEEKFRAYAHYLAGAPSSFHDFTDALLRVDLDDARLGYDLLGKADAASLARIQSRAHEALGDGPVYDHFANRTAKLFAFRSWTNGITEWPSTRTRNKFAAVEDAVKEPTLKVIADLEAIAATMPAVAEGAQADPGQAVATLQIWTGLSQRVEAAADDVCALFALYAENADDLPVLDNPISDLLRDLIHKARLRRSGQPVPAADPAPGPAAPEQALPRHATSGNEAEVLLSGVLIAGVVALAIGYVGAAANILGYNEPWHALAFRYVLSVAVLYGPPSYLAWAARPRNGSAGRPGGGALTRLAFYPRLFLFGFAASVLSLSLYTLSDLAAWHLGSGNPFDPAVLLGQFFGTDPGLVCETGKTGTVTMARYAAVYGTMGAVHGVMTALMAKTVRAGHERGMGRVLIVGHGLALGATCLLAAVALDRVTPCIEGAGEWAAALGLTLNLAEELVAFEVIAAFVLGVTFAAVTRAAVVEIRDNANRGGQGALRAV